MKRLDHHDAVEFTSLQDPRVRELSGQSLEQLRQAVHFVRPDGAVFAGAAAARELFRYLWGGRVVRLILGAPGVMPLAERIYAWIARTRGPVR